LHSVLSGFLTGSAELAGIKPHLPQTP
jgi:hypothetical protein